MFFLVPAETSDRGISRTNMFSTTTRVVFVFALRLITHAFRTELIIYFNRSGVECI